MGEKKKEGGWGDIIGGEKQPRCGVVIHSHPSTPTFTLHAHCTPKHI